MRPPALTAALFGVTLGVLGADTGSITMDLPKTFVDPHPSPRAAEIADTPAIEATKVVVATADAEAIAERPVPQASGPTAAQDDPVAVAALPPPKTEPALDTEVRTTADPKDEAPPLVQILDECFVLEICVDHYLFELYQRAAKVDTSKVYDRRKVKVWRKGRAVTVTRSVLRLVTEDFAWKDPHAAQKAGMSLLDYVIGGMDRDFKLRLYQALRVAEKEGLAPGITSGFRDDYRQSIASGLKAAANRSYHGGSLRGGYGHGLAADLVSTKGATRVQRWGTTEALWKWIDTNEQQYRIGRPYLDRDPPHVTPVDGEEYVARRGTKLQVAGAAATSTQAKAPPRVRVAAKAKPRYAVRAKVVARTAKQKPNFGRSKVAVAKRG